jgi:hypothetical protein
MVVDVDGRTVARGGMNRESTDTFLPVRPLSLRFLV